MPDLNIWDELIIKLAKILDDARWSVHNYSSVKTELCEKVIMTIQPLLNYGSYIGNDNSIILLFIIIIILV